MAVRRRVDLQLTLSLVQAGRPEFGVDVDNIKPMELVVAGALGMLLFGKPLAGSRAFGGMQFGLPVNGDATAKVGAPVPHPVRELLPSCALLLLAGRLAASRDSCFANKWMRPCRGGPSCPADRLPQPCVVWLLGKLRFAATG